MQGLPASALLDTGALDRYVNSDIVKRTWVRMQESKL